MKLRKAQYRKFERICREVGLEPTNYDLKAEWDSTLTAFENWRIIKEKFGLNKIEHNEDEHKNIELEQRLEEMQKTKKEFERSLKEIRNKTSTELDKYFGDIKKLIKATIFSKDIHSLILESEAGLGKTFTTVETLVGLGFEHNKDFRLLRGHLSPLELYHQLWKFQNNIIILDDPTELLKDPTSRRILMSASWSPTDIRKVEWLSSTPKLEAPVSFEFKGKLIYCVNQLSDELGTLKSRSYYYRFNFDWQTKLKIAYGIAKIQNISFDKIDWIKTNKLYNFDFRLPIKLKNLGEDWKELGSKIAEADYRLILMAELMESNRSVENQIKEWKEKIGQSRATYFNLKKKYFPKSLKV